MYSGYLDVTEDKHIFYWLVEAAESPETAPGIYICLITNVSYILFSSDLGDFLFIHVS